VIEFLCPNGHRIRCQPEHAGRAARCPRCGVRFRVPDPADSDVSEAAGISDPGISRPDFSDSESTSKKLPTAGEPQEPQIEFLCPNGHRLHGPVSLQGRPGECPECGSRFRIPNYEEISAEEEAASEIGLGHINGRESTVGHWSDAALSAVGPSPARSPASEGAQTAISGRGAASQAMASLVARLWDARPKGATLELVLRDGATIVPEQFLKKLSQQSRQGVFSMKEADGNMALVAVAWDAVARAALRGLKELPKDLAE
jgi:hypothetical protein